MIKKRKGWHANFKPTMASAPRKPEPTLTYAESKILETYYGSYVNLASISVPDGHTLADVSVSAEADSDGDITLTFSIDREVTKPNPTYERELKLYEKRHEEWRARKAEHKQEVKEWEAWRLQEEKAQLDEQLKAAAALLRKHGHIKD